MTTGERIKARRKEIGLSADQVAEALNVSRSTIFRYEKGDIEKMPIDILEPISKILGTTPAYLMGWTDSADSSIGVHSNILPLPATRTIPLIGSIACGTPILADENVDNYINMPEHVQADFCLRCKGDSMTDARILDGDIVFIRQQPDVDNGTIAAVLIGEEATLKRVHKEGNRLILQAANPAYPPMVYVNGELDNIRIIGKAVAFLSAVK